VSILSGSYIRDAVKRGEIKIDPFREEMINPASIDLTLGDEVAFYQNSDEYYTLDARCENKVRRERMAPSGYQLQPRCGYLMHTVERVGSPCYVPVLDGKSSLGRLFVQVHATAGYGDPGFYGQWTLEVTVTHPVRLYPGMRIAQMRFHKIEGAVSLYQGNYTGEGATGPVPSRSWRQFGGG
jgi:dCTP deaminase